MAAGTLNLTIEQGATYRNTLTWKTGATVAAALPVNLTGYTARMQFRATPDDAVIVLSLTDVLSASGQLVLGGVAGTIQIHLTATATAGLSAGGVYDLELVNGAEITRVVEGSYGVVPNVTR